MVLFDPDVLGYGEPVFIVYVEIAYADCYSASFFSHLIFYWMSILGFEGIAAEAVYLSGELVALAYEVCEFGAHLCRLILAAISAPFVVLAEGILFKMAVVAIKDVLFFIVYDILIFP